MDDSTRRLGAVPGDVAVFDVDDERREDWAGDQRRGQTIERSPMSKATRSLSDGGGTPGQKLSPSPLIIEAARRISKDDSSIRDPPPPPLPTLPPTLPTLPALPVTPSRSEFQSRAGESGLSLHMPPRDVSPAAQTSSSYIKPVPLSPKLDHSQIYASPSALPRRSRGLDFSRAATSLHHSTLAEQSSPDSSPTISGGGGGGGGGRSAMNIPGSTMGGQHHHHNHHHHPYARRGGDFGGGGATESSNSLWSVMGHHEKMTISTSLGSANNLGSDSSSSSDDMDDLMDEDMMDEPFMTPQISKTTMLPGLGSPYGAMSGGGVGPAGGSPAMNSLLSFQQRQRPRKQLKKKLRGPIGLGFHSIMGGGGGSGGGGVFGLGSGGGGTANPMNPMLGSSKSPPNNNGSSRESPQAHSRRESISWAANQLNISSGNESDDGMKSHMDSVESMLGAPGRDGQKEVIRRVVTRRGNLLPKTKAFARMRAALMEESAPIESEVRREAEVVRQVRESDMDLEPRGPPPPLSVATTALSSPQMGGAAATQEMMDDLLLADDAMMVDPSSSAAGGPGLSSSFKQQALRNSRGSKTFWDTFSESSGGGNGSGNGGATPPPPSLMPRGSSSAVSNDDMSMDSPSGSGVLPAGGIFPLTMTNSSSGGNTPQLQLQQQQQQQQPQQSAASGSGTAAGMTTSSSACPPPPGPPSAAEITRRINSKRRRGDDDDRFDPASFKRRAVSPGVSVHNSPIMQSPLQRDMPWGSRPGSNGHDTVGNAGRVGGGGGGGGASGAPSESGGSQASLQQQSQQQPQGGNGGGSAGSGSGSGGRVSGNKGRVGYQGMADTNDGITKLSIE